MQTTKPADRRLIPAGAGNTSPIGIEGPTLPAHPRGCGEHVVLDESSILKSGSSPRVRGTRARAANAALLGRLIPAGAGNTHARSALHASTPAHPRGCGEHEGGDRRAAAHLGSSPRVRGTRGCVASAGAGGRLIPAGAGNTGRRRRAGQRHAAHPRGCGEHRIRDPAQLPLPGSSPRVRGTRYPRLPDQEPARLIPAGAGNTARVLAACMRRTAHPRGCGEHQGNGAGHQTVGGSSPRVRGTPFLQAVGKLTLIHLSKIYRSFHLSAHPRRAARDSGPGSRGNADSGPKATKRKPSSSMGTRRLAPHVSNANPASSGDDHAITALPSSI